ncbi:MLX-interacting protein-like [Antedon mediterranea]|uniref:MLX-interacting protein-like n=1 Tax=Antedon mediterranea TaxID=105859 RepID=UPI003AF4AF9D
MMARDDVLNAKGKLQLMQGSEEDQNYKEKERMKLRSRSSSGPKPGCDEQIHSGHFMVSDPHRGKKKDKVGFDFVSANKDPSTSYSFGENKNCSTNEIESSFSKLFECLSLAYNGGRIVSPKWKWFRGLKLSTKDKIRLNNAIWREWHMQFRGGRPPIVCQFASPLTETNHSAPEAVILEGKYWKRTPSTVVSEYNKWRIFMMQQKKIDSSAKSNRDKKHAELIKNMKFDIYNEEPMVFEDSFFADFHDTLFTSLNQPFAFPNPKELAHMNNADMIQPGLVQLQPTLESSFDDFMDTLEPFQADLTRSLAQSNSTFVFTGTESQQQVDIISFLDCNFPSIQQRRYEPSLLLPISTVGSTDHSMQSLETDQNLGSNFNTQMLSNDPQMLSNESPMLTNNAQMLSDPSQMSSNNAQMLSNATQMLRNASQMLSNTSQMSSNNSQLLNSSPQVLGRSQILSGNSQILSHSSQILSNNSATSDNASLYNTVQVNDLGQFQGPYPIQITEALGNTSKDEFTASLVEQFRQDEAQLDQQRQNIVDVTQMLTQQQQNVTLLNPIVDSQLTIQQGQPILQGVTPQRTLVSLTQPTFSAPQVTMHNPQTIFTKSAVQILQQAATQAAEQKPVITHFVKAPVLQPQQAAPQQVQFTQPTASIVLPAASTHQVILPLPVSHTTVVHRDVFTVPKSKPPTRRIAPAPGPSTSSSSNSTTALLSQLLNKETTSKTGVVKTSTTSLVPTILKSELSMNSTCVITSTTPIFKISTSNMVNAASGAKPKIPTSPISTTTINPLAILPDSTDLKQGHRSRDDDDKDFKKSCTHISAEQKRRFNIKSGFDMLHSLIPSINQNPSSKISKASMLQKGVDYTKKLKQERIQHEKEIELLRQEIAALNISINESQAQLPASGVPVTRQRFDQMQNMFDDYVRERTKQNWKFWIFSIIIRPLFESFNTVVSTSSKEELLRTVLSWLDQHCSLLALRPTVLSSLTLLGRTTSILSNPEQMPQQAAKAVNKDEDDMQ